MLKISRETAMTAIYDGKYNGDTGFYYSEYNKYSYNKMMWSLTKWSFDSFYPDHSKSIPGT